MRNAANKVGGAIKRVDDPSILRILTPDKATLFPQNSVIGVRLLQLVNNFLLGVEINLRYEVVNPFGFYFKAMELIRRSHDVFTGFTSSAKRNFNHRFHVSFLRTKLGCKVILLSAFLDREHEIFLRHSHHQRPGRSHIDRRIRTYQNTHY